MLGGTEVGGWYGLLEIPVRRILDGVRCTLTFLAKGGTVEVVLE